MAKVVLERSAVNHDYVRLRFYYTDNYGDNRECVSRPIHLGIEDPSRFGDIVRDVMPAAVAPSLSQRQGWRINLSMRSTWTPASPTTTRDGC